MRRVYSRIAASNRSLPRKIGGKSDPCSSSHAAPGAHVACDNLSISRPLQAEVPMSSPAESASSSPLQLIRAKRRLPAILLSVALHVSVLALAAYLGTLARTRFVEPTPFQTLALLDTAGGSHAVRIELPPSDFAAHTRTPTKDPDTSHKTSLPVEQPAPKMLGGGAPKAPHAGDGAGQAVIGNGSDNDDVHPAFPRSRRNRLLPTVHCCRPPKRRSWSMWTWTFSAR